MRLSRAAVTVPMRVACTPYQGGLRVAGTMEFRDADAPLDEKRIEAVVRSTRPLLSGVDWQRRHHEWVGGRPVTPDGLPLIGASRMPGAFVACLLYTSPSPRD